MAVAVGSTSTLALGNRTNSTITAPSGISDGDALVICMSAGVNNGNDTGLAVTGPSGFAAIVDGFNFNFEASDTYGVDMYVFWKVASGEAGNYTCTHGTGDTEAIMYRCTGADPTTPLNPTPTTNAGIPPEPDTGTTSTATSITTPEDDSLVIYFTSCWNDAGPTTPPAGTTPTFAERYDPGNSGVVYAADGVLATAGATGDKSNTNGNSAGNQPWGAILISVAAPAGVEAEVQLLGQAVM